MDLTYDQKVRLREVYLELGFNTFQEALDSFKSLSESPENLKAFKESLSPADLLKLKDEYFFFTLKHLNP